MSDTLIMPEMVSAQSTGFEAVQICPRPRSRGAFYLRDAMAYQLERKPATMWWDANASDSLAKTFYEPEPHFTGIIDRDGNRIMRVMDTIGFVRRSQQ